MSIAGTNQVFFDNYNNTVGVKTDAADQFHKWFYSIIIRDKNGGRHIVYPAIFSNFALRKSERVQIVNGFNEAVHLYAFGKNADQLQLGGHILASTIFNFSFLGTKRAILTPYDKVLRAYSAAELGPEYRTTVSGPGGVLVTGVATDFSLSMNGAINSVLDFSMSFIAVDSMMGIGTPVKRKSISTSGELNILF